jgi:hypothetical protein
MYFISKLFAAKMRKTKWKCMLWQKLTAYSLLLTIDIRCHSGFDPKPILQMESRLHVNGTCEVSFGKSDPK